MNIVLSASDGVYAYLVVKLNVESTIALSDLSGQIRDELVEVIIEFGFVRIFVFILHFLVTFLQTVVVDFVTST